LQSRAWSELKTRLDLRPFDAANAWLVPAVRESLIKGEFAMFSLFGKRRPSATQETSLRHRLNLDRLETRCLMSAAALVGTDLVITGTRGDDNLEVWVPKLPPAPGNNSLTPVAAVNSAQAMAASAELALKPLQSVSAELALNPVPVASGEPMVATKVGIRTPVVFVLNNGVEIGVFGLDSFKRIQVYGFGGNDKIVVSDQIHVPTFLDGGAGDDTLVAGSGPTIALGRMGHDLLIGGDNRDILIGGDGEDTIRGSGGDDILIAGRTRFDDSPAKLFVMQDIWTSGDPYKARVETLRYGADGFLGGALPFVIYDGSFDSLEGGPGMDWFFAGPNTKIQDLGPSEKLN
jgi:RTX calcium-binding nonapeptide repeat (4 copies)